VTVNILIVDDDLDTAQLVKVILKPLNALTYHAFNGQEGLKLAYELQPDLIILDIMMSGLDGFEVCSRMREFSDVPILMLTAKSQGTDLQRGFAVGADDYVKKPFSNVELFTRINYLLNRKKNGDTKAQGSNIKEYYDGTLKVNFREQQVFLHNKKVCLTPTEYKLLDFLAKHPHKNLTARKLLIEVWGDAYSHDKSQLTYYIHQLRQKLKEGEATHNYIRTLWGQGYWFNPLPRSMEPALEATIYEQMEGPKKGYLSLRNKWALPSLARLDTSLVLVIFKKIFHLLCQPI